VTILDINKREKSGFEKLDMGMAESQKIPEFYGHILWMAPNTKKYKMCTYITCL